MGRKLSVIREFLCVQWQFTVAVMHHPSCWWPPCYMGSGAHKLLELATQHTLHIHAFSRSYTQASFILTDLFLHNLTLLTSTWILSVLPSLSVSSSGLPHSGGGGAVCVTPQCLSAHPIQIWSLNCNPMKPTNFIPKSWPHDAQCLNRLLQIVTPSLPDIEIPWRQVAPTISSQYCEKPLKTSKYPPQHPFCPGYNFFKTCTNSRLWWNVFLLDGNGLPVVTCGRQQLLALL